ncbi:zinc finger BED domain-containing protein 4-like [Xyrauchen texanus]|uniref:zinc finger BED domain-containing protein 4-like n=1 Tax=Xyrauchen texanus TaxID=154827 RepID=UPI002242A0EC|nr:zinc finger BED domain-containing protein 4-like [Xyrauchen texanus]
MAPIAVVEQRGFVRMLKTLDSRYSLPSRHFARQELPRLYTTERERLAAELENVTDYALTTDMWSSRTCKPYMCVTIHYILDWKIKSACLQTTYFPQDHTGENIAEALRDVTTTWMLNPNGPVAITTDNGGNIVCAVQNNNWQRMQCFGHRLHLAIGHGMQDPRITRAISLCKKTVSAFSYSWKKRRELAEVQAQMNLPAHQLSTESTTRWGSRLQMVERILEQERADPVPPIAKKKKTLASFFVQDATPYSSSFTPRESIENELSSYLQSVCLESEADPLQWWQEHEVAYPALSNLACH